MVLPGYSERRRTIEELGSQGTLRLIPNTYILSLFYLSLRKEILVDEWSSKEANGVGDIAFDAQQKRP